MLRTWRLSVSKDLRFRRLPDETSDAALVHFTWNGEAMTAGANETLAAALLANGVTVFGHAATTGRARGPYCMMGSCFECRVSIDGIENQQSCMTPIRDGLVAETNTGRPVLHPQAAIDSDAAGDDH